MSEKNKITIPSTLGPIEVEYGVNTETPEDMVSLMNVNVNIQPVVANNIITYNNDPFVDMVMEKKGLRFCLKMEYINTKKADIQEDEEYYFLKIDDYVRIPKNKQLALHVSLEITMAKILFLGRPSKEEIVKRARKEMAHEQTTFNPNTDGRFPKGVYYGGGF